MVFGKLKKENGSAGAVFFVHHACNITFFLRLRGVKHVKVELCLLKYGTLGLGGFFSDKILKLF